MRGKNLPSSQFPNDLEKAVLTHFDHRNIFKTSHHRICTKETMNSSIQSSSNLGTHKEKPPLLGKSVFESVSARGKKLNQFSKFKTSVRKIQMMNRMNKLRPMILIDKKKEPGFFKDDLSFPTISLVDLPTSLQTHVDHPFTINNVQGSFRGNAIRCQIFCPSRNLGTCARLGQA